MKAGVVPRRGARRCRLLAALAALQLVFAAPTGAQVMDQELYTFFLFEQLEFAPDGAGRPIGLDAVGWIGGDYNRLWLRAEGEHLTAEGAGAAQVEALYGRLVAPFWDALLGVGVDTGWGDGSTSRAFLALGILGLAPYWFELAPTLFLSQDGHISARLEGSYDLLFTQRLIAQPEVEVNAALQEVPEFGVGAGLNDLELGLRLRYEIRREFAPYVGVSWVRRFGSTADLARRDGEDVSEAVFVAGVRIWR